MEMLRVPRLVEDIQFGMGHYYSEDIPDIPGEVYYKALRCGWSNGCPIARELCDPKNTDYTPEGMLNRYSEVNYGWQSIKYLTDRYNRDLTDSVFFIRQRRTNPVGKYEPLSVPPAHMEYMAPMCTIYGYATPRIMVATFGVPYHGPRHIRIGELFEGFIEPLKGCRDQDDFLIEACKLALEQRVEIPTILSHVFSAGWLQEENSPGDLSRIANLMEARTPDLTYAYLTMSDEEKGTHGITTKLH